MSFVLYGIINVTNEGYAEIFYWIKSFVFFLCSNFFQEVFNPFQVSVPFLFPWEIELE